MWNLKYDTYDLTYKTETDLTDIESRFLVACQGQESRRGMVCEFGVSRCKLQHIKWINNKVLLCSTKNYIQYPIVNHSVKYITYIYN